jgi:hypothetical protein
VRGLFDMRRFPRLRFFFVEELDVPVIAEVKQRWMGDHPMTEQLFEQHYLTPHETAK